MAVALRFGDGEQGAPFPSALAVTTKPQSDAAEAAPTRHASS